MTYEERRIAINRKLVHDNVKRLAKEKADNKTLDDLRTEIENLTSRIREIIDIANAVLDNGFNLPKDSYHYEALAKYGYKYNAMSDGIAHGVGFMRPNNGTIMYVGFYAGGACGSLDFYTDGESAFHLDSDRNNTIKPLCIEDCSIEDCKKFLEMFPKFEKAFYAWFDEVFGEETA